MIELWVQFISAGAAGVALFTLLRRIGQLDLVVSLLYVVFLGGVGGLMLVESILLLCATGRRSREILRKKQVYAVIKVLDLSEESEAISEKISECVDYLIATVMLGGLIQIVFAALGQFGDPEGTGHERGRHFNILRQLSNLVIA